jgi:hypothetical protein
MRIKVTTAKFHVNSSTLKKGTECNCVILVNVYQTTRCQGLEDGNFHNQCNCQRCIWQIRFRQKDVFIKIKTNSVRRCHCCVNYYLLLFSLALQPSAGYDLLWICSPARAMASCATAAQRPLRRPVTLQTSAGYGLLLLCCPARAMASCCSAAQRGLWPPVALQPSAGYGLL